MGTDNNHNRIEELWLEEIIRETEHYYQGEVQQEQRASWILATVCVLIAILANVEFNSSGLLLTLIFVSFYISGVISIFTIIPLRGTKFKIVLFGKHYRKDKNLELGELIQQKFRTGEKWSEDEYKKRVLYHFRSHYLRGRIKEYGVVWSSLFLLLGFVLLGIYGLCLLSI